MTDQVGIALSIAIALCVLALLSAMGAVAVVLMSLEGRDRESPERSTDPGDGALRPRAWSLIRRALAWRCPRCGRGALFQSYFKMKRACDDCGAIFWKQPGEWMGPSMIDYSIAAGAALVTWAVLEVFAVREPLQLPIIIAALLAAAALSFPWSRSFWTLLLFVARQMR